jgi:hypothetical protein
MGKAQRAHHGIEWYPVGIFSISIAISISISIGFAGVYYVNPAFGLGLFFSVWFRETKIP